MTSNMVQLHLLESLYKDVEVHVEFFGRKETT